MPHRSTTALLHIQDQAQQLSNFIDSADSLLVLSGAGISTASGIPEYRDSEGNWKHSKPIQYQDFVQSNRVYRRYWARSAIGWQTMGKAQPNSAHQALVQLEQRGQVHSVITQNVDQLHQAAGHQRVINLHGQLHTVSCQKCQHCFERTHIQQLMHEQNFTWFESHTTLERQQKPDGDADIADDSYADFDAPLCNKCGGKIKPDVVFFGENIPQQTAKAALLAQQQANALLIVGSSLMVFSGFRIARSFHQRNLPIALINQGKTRADDIIENKFIADASKLLPLAL